MKNSGKIFERKVKLLKELPVDLCVGGIYTYKALRNRFPFLDLENEEFFETQWEDSIKKGEKVRYIGGESVLRGLQRDVIYTVVNTEHLVVGDRVTTTYVLEGPEGTRHKAGEGSIEPAPSMWVVSFSNSRQTKMPAVHEVDRISYEKRLKGTWKEIFCFDNEAEARRVAHMFSCYEIKDIYNNIMNITH